MRRHTLFGLLIGLCFAGGCVEIAFMLGVGGGRGSGGGVAPDGENGLPPANGSADIPVVTLTASNTSPQADEDVAEEVLLVCVVEGGQGAGSAFAFQPDDGRLIVDEQTGTASFIPSAADVGQAFSYTCTATNALGTSAPSNQVTIIPQAGSSTSDEETE